MILDIETLRLIVGMGAGAVVGMYAVKVSNDRQAQLTDVIAKAIPELRTEIKGLSNDLHAQIEFCKEHYNSHDKN